MSEQFDVAAFIGYLWREREVGSPKHRLAEIRHDERIVCTCGKTITPERWLKHREGQR